MNLSVSVLCPVWNNARYLGEAIASARAQTRPADEIIVLDDGSSDESAAVAESFAGVRVLLRPHRGVAAARNELVENATGDLVAFLDSDDVWTPDKLSVQVAFMETHPRVGVSYTHQRLRLEPGLEPPAWVPKGAEEAVTPVLGTCSMIARRALFATVGWFDPAFEPNDDTDWLVRAVSLGVEHVMLPDALLWRRVHDRNLTHRSRPWAKEVFMHLRASIRRQRQGRAGGGGVED